MRKPWIAAALVAGVSLGALAALAQGTSTPGGALAPILSGTHLGYYGGGTAIPVASPAASLMEQVCSSTGQMYIVAPGGASGCLSHGTVGQWLQQQQPSGNFAPVWTTLTSFDHISYQPGLQTSIVNSIGAFHKFTRAATVTNIEVSADQLTCVTPPTITVFNCGVSKTCATPTTIGTGAIATVSTVVDGTITAASVAAGNYVAFEITAGACTLVDPYATVEVSYTD